MRLEEIFNRFSGETSRMYFVGGYVRDKAMGISPKDADIVVFDVSIDRMTEIAGEFGWKADGEAFPVYIAKTSDWGDVEIALPRKEKSTGNGYTDFEIFCDPYLSVEEDAKRRDFTFNAMYENVFTGEIIDTFGGQRHIKDGKIFPVANFSDDPVRVLRAARFSLRFGWKISFDLFNEMANMEKVPFTPERLGKELTKIAEQYSNKNTWENLREALEILHTTGWLEVILPDIDNLFKVPFVPDKYHGESCIDHVCMVTNFAMKTMVDSPPIVRLLCGLFHDAGKYTTYRWNKDKNRYQYIGHEFHSADMVMKAVEWNIPKQAVILAKKIIQNHMKIHEFASKKTLFKLWQEMGKDIYQLFSFGICDEMGRIAEEGRGIDHIISMAEIIEKWVEFPKTTGKILGKKVGYPKNGEDGRKFGEKLTNVQRQEFYRLYEKLV